MSFLKNIFGSNTPSEENQSKIHWNELNNVEQLEQIKIDSATKPVVIFKHSTRCVVSRMALKQFENEYNLENKVVPYYLDLLENRDISNAIAAQFDITHQSPQIIVIKQGKATYNASHNDISVENLSIHL